MNRNSARPRLASQRRTICSATARSKPGARGSGASGGRYRSACSASSNGDGSCSSRAPSMPEPAAHEAEVIARGERGRAQDRAADAIPERLAQHLPDHHGAAHRRAPSSARSLQTTVSSGSASRHCSSAKARRCVWRATRSHSSPPPSRCAASVESAPRRPLVAATGARRGRRGACACACPIAERGSERSAVALHVDEIRARAPAAVALAGPLDLAREPDQVGDADARAEPLGRDVLELVRLVEDDHVVLGQHADRGRRRRSAARGRRSTGRG